MKAKHGTPKEKIASGKTEDGHDYFINEYPATKTYSQWERVGYVQLPHAVAFVVLPSRDQASYRKDSLPYKNYSRALSTLSRKPVPKLIKRDVRGLIPKYGQLLRHVIWRRDCLCRGRGC
jgi:hypothetical protein